MSIIKNLTFGTDPEFVMVDKWGAYVQARDIPYLDWNGNFGMDGDIFEVRSDYSHNTIYIVDSIHKILKEAFTKIKGAGDYNWLAGHYQGNEPIGGHIHIGNIPFNIGDDRGKITPLTTALGKSLIGGISKLIDDQQQLVQRHTAGYGRITDWRMGASHGGEDEDPHRLEYRGTGSFLVSPEVTFLNLIVAKTIAMHYFNDKKTLSVMSKGLTSLSILKEILILMKDSIFSGEGDIGLGREVLTKCIKGDMVVNWNEDFKKNWGL